MFVTLVAVFGATGVLPIEGTSEPASARETGPKDGPAALATPPTPRDPGAIALSGAASAPLPADVHRERQVEQSPGAEPPTAIGLPEGSGEGKRVVFDISDQRVWLVTARDRVRRTYLVSGSLTDNLGPGTYEVYSRSRHATGIDDSGTMQYMVRFTQGENAAIGFHDIPIHRGEKVQTRSQLGSPQSHGCIRQLRADAKVLWRFAPVGAQVVVLD